MRGMRTILAWLWATSSACLPLAMSQPTEEDCTGQDFSFTTTLLIGLEGNALEATPDELEALEDILTTAYNNAAGSETPGAFVQVTETRVVREITDAEGNVLADPPSDRLVVEFDVICKGCNGVAFANVGRRRLAWQPPPQQQHYYANNNNVFRQGPSRVRRKAAPMGRLRPTPVKGMSSQSKMASKSMAPGKGMSSKSAKSGKGMSHKMSPNKSRMIPSKGMPLQECDCDLPLIETYLLECNELIIERAATTPSISSLSGASLLSFPEGTGGGGGDGTPSTFTTFATLSVDCAVGLPCTSDANLVLLARGIASVYNGLNAFSLELCDPDGRVITNVVAVQTIPATPSSVDNTRRRLQLDLFSVVFEITATYREGESSTVIFGDHAPPDSRRQLLDISTVCATTGQTPVAIGCPRDEEFAQALEEWIVDRQEEDGDLLSLASIDAVEESSSAAPTERDSPTAAPSMTPTSSAAPSMTPTSSASPTQECLTCVEGCIDVVDFVLVNANTNVELRSIVRDEVFSLAALQTEFGTDQYSIICITDPAPFTFTPFAIGSTILYDTYENVGGDNERNPPYALDGDDNTNFTPINFRTGPWLVSCEAFCGVNFDGIRSPLRNITFSVVP